MHYLFLITIKYPFLRSGPTLNKLCARPRTYKTSLMCFAFPCFMFTKIVLLPLASIGLSSPKSTSYFVDSYFFTKPYLFPIM